MKEISEKTVKELAEGMFKCSTTMMNGRASNTILSKEDYPEMIWELAKHIAKKRIMAEIKA